MGVPEIAPPWKAEEAAGCDGVVGRVVSLDREDGRRVVRRQEGVARPGMGVRHVVKGA
jgi:hypothetical protein